MERNLGISADKVDLSSMYVKMKNSYDVFTTVRNRSAFGCWIFSYTEEEKNILLKFESVEYKQYGG